MMRASCVAARETVRERSANVTAGQRDQLAGGTDTEMARPGPTLHSVSVAAVIVRDDGRILTIQRRDTGDWQPPGGVLERHETITGALIREVEEEAGVTVKPVALTGVYKNLDNGIVALVYRCRIRRRVWTKWRSTGDETIDVRWMSRREVIAEMDGVFAARILDGLDHQTKPAVRYHNGRAFVWAWLRWATRWMNPISRRSAGALIPVVHRVATSRGERGIVSGVSLALVSGVLLAGIVGVVLRF